jgi:hypothetical protein
VFNDLVQEVNVRFVDIGRIVDHHCLNILFIIGKTPLNKMGCRGRDRTMLMSGSLNAINLH